MVAEAEQMGADAVIGVDYESIQIGQGGSMLMVSASGQPLSCRALEILLPREGSSGEASSQMD
jgi:hypothetical protein